MSVASPTTANTANRGSEHTSVKAKRTSVDFKWMADLIDVAIGIWPKKTALNLAHTAHVSERAAEFWIAGTYDMSLPAARELLRTEQGFEYLVALVGDDCEAAWFVKMRLHQQVSVSSRRIRAEEKRTAALREKLNQISFDLDQ
jgi:hypothetical protein